MASYKVPQDVEADDKLIGPFSFRQFIYLIIAVLGIVIGWGLSRLFIPLAIIPLPVVLLFGALALPLRKDQPMEIYLAAVVSFFLKPRKRIWKPDGIQSLVEVVAPHVEEVQRTKTFSGTEAEQRLAYLADLVDTRGWSVRGVATQPTPQTAMMADAYNEAMQAPDILDDSGGVARSFDTMISTANTRRHDEMIARMHGQATVPPPPQPTAQAVVIPPPTDPYTSLQPTVSPDAAVPHLSYSPYPAMHQSVIDPSGDRGHPTPPQTTPVAVDNSVAQSQNQQPPTPPNITTSEKSVSPDIMNLANNSDLSIETIAHEAKRIQEKEAGELNDEVVVSLH